MVVGRRGRVGTRRVQPGEGSAGRRAGGVGGRRPRRRPPAAHDQGAHPGCCGSGWRPRLEAAVVAETLDRLERVGLADDAALAETVAAGRAERGLDAPAIAAELRDRGVDPTVAERPPTWPSRLRIAPTAAARLPKPDSPSSPIFPP